MSPENQAPAVQILHNWEEVKQALNQSDFIWYKDYLIYGVTVGPGGEANMLAVDSFGRRCLIEPHLGWVSYPDGIGSLISRPFALAVKVGKTDIKGVPG